MARIDTLGNFLTDVAAAIKDKTGKTDTITPANFDTEISSIEGGGTSENLTEELNAYNTELTNQETTLEDILDVLRTKAAGSGASVYHPYICDVYRNETTGKSVSMTLSNVNQYDVDADLALVYFWVRSNYTVSEDVTILAEKDCPTYNDGTNQKLVVGYTTSNMQMGNTLFTVTQEAEARIGYGYIMLGNCEIPEFIDDVNITGKENSTIVETDEYLNIYIETHIGGVGTFLSSGLAQHYPSKTNQSIARTSITISHRPQENLNITNSGSNSWSIIHIRCKALV